MMDTYFVISVNEDGEVRIETLNKQNLLHDLNEGFYENPASEIENTEIQEWREHSCVIIKGKIVVPKPVQVVREYEVE